VFVYHCFDRIFVHGYLSGLSHPEQVVFFFCQVVGAPVVSKELLSQRTTDYQNWVEAFARNHDIPIQWAEKGLRKEDLVQPSSKRPQLQQELNRAQIGFRKNDNAFLAVDDVADLRAAADKLSSAIIRERLDYGP
jgi:hypothetical protein